MSWQLSVEEIDAVSALAGAERYAYFVKHCVDWEEIWGLRDQGGWVSAQDETGELRLPVWPHREYARRCADHEWAEAAPTAIGLDVWVDGWLSDLEATGRLISVFPLPDGSGVPVEPDRLRRDLQAEMAVYE